MSDVLLSLWNDKRSYLLQELDFYLNQADKRVLTQFGDLEEEAEQFARDEFDRMGQYAGPDADPAGYAEAAWDKGINHFQMLSDLHNQLLLSVAAGLYHQWEKQFREWLSRELGHSLPRLTLAPDIWGKNIEELRPLLTALGWDFSTLPFFSAMEECRLVVNVYKHGLGKSFDELKKRFPHRLGKKISSSDTFDFRDHSDLRITREDLGRFQAALVAFWKAMPQHISWDDTATFPKWFERAIKAAETARASCATMKRLSRFMT